MTVFIKPAMVQFNPIDFFTPKFYFKTIFILRPSLPRGLIS